VPHTKYRRIQQQSVQARFLWFDVHAAAVVSGQAAF
jgi:hypothetical protein